MSYNIYTHTHTRNTACFIIYSQDPWGCGDVSLIHAHTHIKNIHTLQRIHTRLYPFDPARGGHASPHPPRHRRRDRFFSSPTPRNSSLVLLPYYTRAPDHRRTYYNIFITSTPQPRRRRRIASVCPPSER